MTTVTELLSLGSPRFADTALKEIETAQGAGAAWCAALAHAPDPAALVAGAQGHFAVGLRRADGHAVLAVDRFAAQTLCYAQRGGRLLFAERADTLAGPNPQIDLQALYDDFHAIPSPRTAFKGVHASRLATALTATPAGCIRGATGRPAFRKPHRFRCRA